MKVKCRTLFNEERLVEADTLIQRPSVYGLVVHDHKVLVVRGLYTKRYVLPGGGIEKGESIEAALIREVREETGVPVAVGRFLHFETDFFYYDPQDLALHGFLFYYACEPLALELGERALQPDEGLEEPVWVDLDTLTEHDFESHGALIMRLLRALCSTALKDA